MIEKIPYKLSVFPIKRLATTICLLLSILRLTPACAYFEEEIENAQRLPTTVGDVALGGAGMVGGATAQVPKAVNQTIKLVRPVKRLLTAEQKAARSAATLAKQAPAPPQTATQSLTLLTEDLAIQDRATRSRYGIGVTRNDHGRIISREISVPTTSFTTPPRPFPTTTPVRLLNRVQK